MLLFESFTYDDKWASLYYDNFYNSSEYIEKWLNDGYTENGHFGVNMCYSKDHDNDRYHISYINNADIFDNRFPYDAFVYAYEKLKSYGDAITVAPGCWPEEKDGDNQSDIIIKYDIKMDENRWNEEHAKYEEAFNSNEVLECKPSFEQWLYMINARFEKKQPKRIFAKESNLKYAAAKFIIAIKLGWEDAEIVLTDIMSFLLTKSNYARFSDKFPRFIKVLEAYAKEKYEIDPDIQEIINDIQSVDKHVGDIKIPSKYYEIAKKLDQNALVKKYQFTGLYDNAFNIQTTNDNFGRIYIDEDEKLGKDFFFITLHLKDTHSMNDEKSNSYKFKALPSIIDSAVNAIYYNDYKKLHEVTIKIK